MFMDMVNDAEINDLHPSGQGETHKNVVKYPPAISILFIQIYFVHHFYCKFLDTEKYLLEYEKNNLLPDQLEQSKPIRQKKPLNIRKFISNYNFPFFRCPINH